MTQQSISTNQRRADIGQFVEGAKRSVAVVLSSAPDIVRSAWKDHPEWFEVAIPMAVLAAYAYVMTWNSWFGYDKVLAFQPFVPLAVAYAIWRDREHVKLIYDDETELFVPESPRRRGSLIPLFIGCLIVMAGAVTTLTTLSIVGLVFSLISCIYCLFGVTAIRILFQPIFYLIFLIPPPLAAITWLTLKLQLGSTLVAGQILQTFMHDVHVQGTFIMLPNYVLEVSAPCSGVSILFPVFALTAFLALFKRLHLSWTGILLVVSLVIAMTMNVLRIVVMGAVGGFSPDTARFLHDSNSVVFAALSFYLTFLVASWIQRGPRRRLSEFERDLQAAYADDFAYERESR